MRTPASGMEILERAFLAGASDLRRRAALLDRINVFPVVDADTGANMGHTLGSGVEAIESGDPDMVSRIQMGARGNSGVILAQFIVGFFDALEGVEPDQADLVRAVSTGRDMAYRAVADPVEGTMLTVMTDMAKHLEVAGVGMDAAGHRELEEVLARSVARTPELMERLVRAGVVDSGALGFHVFACGLALALPALEDRDAGLEAVEARRNGETAAPIGEIEEAIDPVFLEAEAADESRLRYCMDVVIEAGAPPPERWKELFEEVGASVDAVVRGGMIKLHVHCDDPDAVRRRAARLGEVLRADAEDMTEGLVRVAEEKAGGAAGGGREASFRVVGDSSMTFPLDLAARLGVERIENHVNVRGRMLRDCDLDRDALFARMREGDTFTTAQTSAEEVRRFLDGLAGAPGEVVYMAVGRPYTGTQDLVRSVLEEHPMSARVHVMDTRAASGQQGVAAVAVAREAASATDLEGLLEYARRQIETSREYLVIDSLRFLSRTGRVGRIKATFAGAMGIKPVVGHGGDGAITYAKCRTHEKALEEIVARTADHPGDGPLLVLLEHTDNVAWIAEARDRMADALPRDTEFMVAPLSSTSAVHMGPGTWGVAVTRTRG